MKPRSINRSDVKAEEIDDVARDDFALDSFAPYLLNRITHRMNASLLKALREMKLTVPQWRVLAVLWAKDGRSLNELAVYTVIDQSTLSRTIDRMAAKALVERRTRADDQRFVEVWLTDAGRRAFKRVWPIARAQYAMAIEGLDGKELGAFIATLRKILANVRATPFA